MNKQIERYQPQKIENKWQEVWQKTELYKFHKHAKGEKYYNLVEFPYPSGDLHIGHWFTFAIPDVHARFMKMNGRNVFFPNGFDAFGLPAENAAIKRGVNPKEWTLANIASMREQFRTMGTMIDWSHEVITCLPEFYRWNQWIFIKLWENGLAYRGNALSNWCPSCQTVLANEAIEGGRCWRCGTEVIQKDVEQWFIRITKYADELLWADSDPAARSSQNAHLDSQAHATPPSESSSLASTELSNGVDWPKNVRTAQNEWIGKSEGVNIEFLTENDKKISVFTTRPDTLYGCTFLVLAPEHPLVAELASDKQSKEVTAYINEAQKKTERERKEEKEKTGVFTGSYVVHPLTKVKLPIWTADYVHANYGTGAIMAVPAHDERDFAFATKFNLPIRQVIAPETGLKRENEERRDGGCAVIFDPKTQRYAVYQRENGLTGLFAGGVNDSETMQEGILREVKEESGLHNFEKVEEIAIAYTHFHNSLKHLNRVALATCLLVILENTEKQPTQLESHEDFSLVWKTADEVVKGLHERNQEHDVDHWLTFFAESVSKAIKLGYDTSSESKKYQVKAYTGSGLIVNSDSWNGLSYHKDIDKIITDLEEQGIGKKETTYHIRDWSISRQRYWGTPVPFVYCENCMEDSRLEYGRDHIEYEGKKLAIVPVPEDELPIELPEIKDYRPKGEPPLATAKEWLHVKCPTCGGKAVRDAETLDTFFDSSWYMFRYLNPHLDTAVFSSEDANLLMPVDTYFGGGEHTLGHTLYTRFFTRYFKAQNMVKFDEFAIRRIEHGIVLGPDGNKMSKSKGNVINPDDIVRDYGADATRTYLCFMMPYEGTSPWSTEAVSGVYRFLRRIWELYDKVQGASSDDQLSKTDLVQMHKTIKKVGEDLGAVKMNTAIATLMEWLNHLSRKEKASLEEYKTMLLLLAPFAPFMTEELWERLSLVGPAARPSQNARLDSQAHATSPSESSSLASPASRFVSIHQEAWPEYKEEFLIDEVVKIVVQINGKVRDTISFSQADVADQAKVEAKAFESQKVKKHLSKRSAKKVFYINGKLINFVV